MGRPGKIAKYGLEVEATELRGQGKSLDEIASILSAKLPPGETLSRMAVARFFDSTPKAVRQVVRATRRRCAEVVSAQMRWIDRFQKIHQRTWDILAKLEGENRPHLVHRYIAEVRKQLTLEADIIRMLADAQEIKLFQETVLEVVGEVAPDAREEILRRLERRRALRSALGLNSGHAGPRPR